MSSREEPPPDTGFLKKPISLPGKLDEDDRELWERLNASVFELTPEFKAWLNSFILVEVAPRLGGGSGASVFFNVRDYGAALDGTTDDHAALQATLDAADLVDGTVYVPPGTLYLNPASGYIQLPDGVTLMGAGRGSLITAGETTLSAPANAMLRPKTAGARMIVRDLDLKASPSTGDTNIQYIFHALNNMSAGSSLHLENVNMSRTMYGVLVPTPPTGTSVMDVTAVACRFTGNSSANPSNFIATQQTGGTTRMRDCLVTGAGKTGDNHHHGIYIGSPVNLDVDGCDFLDIVGDGWGVLHYHDSATGAAAAKFSIVRNCRFNSRGVHTSERALITHQVLNCTFDMPENVPAVVISATGRVVGCDITTSGTGGVGVLAGPADVVGDSFTEQPPLIDVVGCTFRGSCDSTVELIGAQSGVNLDQGRLRARGCHFYGAAGTADIRTRAGADLHLHVSGCEFKGTGTNISIYEETGAISQISDNKFDNTGIAAHILRGADTIDESLVGNYFAGVPVSGPIPTAWTVEANFGPDAPADYPAVGGLQIGKWRRTTPATLTTAAWTGLVWETEIQDPGGYGGAGTTFFTVPEDGNYLVTCQVFLSATAGTGDATLSVAAYGAGTETLAYVYTPIPNGQLNGSGICAAILGDTIGAEIFSNATGSPQEWTGDISIVKLT